MVLLASFLDRLTLHLALELLKDAARIQAWLLSPAKEEAANTSNTNRGSTDDRLVLYWRSKPQTGPDPPCFVDITFCRMNDDDGCDISPRREETGQPQKSRRRLTFQVGYLRFERKEGAAADKDATTSSSTYIQNALFSTKDLQHHAQSLDLVLEQATPQTLAASLAQAMQSQWRICHDDDNDDDKGTESLQCYYQELDQWGSLGGAGGISSSCLDATATRLLLQNLKSFEGQNQSHNKKVVTQVDRQACEALLEQWMDSAPSSTNNRETASKTATSVAQATAHAKPAAKKKATAGFRQLPKKRSRKSSELKIRALD